VFPELRLLLVGGGEARADLERIARETDVANRVVFTGLVPYDLVPEYYRLMDILVLPRRDTRETRLVTPLKPMEIMAMAKPLVASDIGGHREIVVDGVNALLFTADHVDDLVSRCGQLLQNAWQRTDLGERGRRWVTEHRDWRVLVKRYIELYRQLTPQTARATIHSGTR
jgi:glycosyltransferase involved in cell wall biosynthesis